MRTLHRMMPGKIKAQTILEYSLLVALFIAAVVATQIYLKRGFQGSLKRSTDTISLGEQFSTSLSNHTMTVKSKAKTKETITPQGEIRTEFLEPEITATTALDDFSDKKLTEEELF